MGRVSSGWRVGCCSEGQSKEASQRLGLVEGGLVWGRRGGYV